MIKTLIFDLDGTLLNSKKEISYQTAEALLKCKQKSIRILHATARPPLLHKMLPIKEKYRQLLYNHEGVYYNGGCIIYKEQKYYKYIPQNIIKVLLENIIRKYGTRINIALLLENEEHSFLHGLPLSEYALWGIEQSQLIDFWSSFEKGIVKVIIFSITDGRNDFPIASERDPTNLENLYNYLQEEHSGSINVFMTDDKNVLQLMGVSVDKGNAIKEYMNMSNLSNDEIAVFGDDYNDLNMLRSFKNSFAMGNARDEVKQAAKYVIRSNDEDGIYFALKDILHLIN